MPAIVNTSPIINSKELSYKEMIKQLAAQTINKPYGDIPPLTKRKKKKEPTMRRRMSHIEDWIMVDSKESLPDEQELLSTDDFFLTHVLPLHMPPPSLSEITKQNVLLGRSLTTTQSCTITTSPPLLANTDQELWNETIAKLKKSLLISPQQQQPSPSKLPLKVKHRRRSEATTQPRFNPLTNTYTRDTRSNSDHLRIISAELNMMRSRKLLSPLKPRGFLPRRKDVFIRGTCRKVSPLVFEIN
ncbi:hypothetical protein G6F37_012253 [Rhizopus arrhizus]|nr:hypothetical protein G6F38_010944 [Rhizopus arrhizus]KAG1144739.1 hypothetical protein G6F37_012253 [Rhizopus arrhizus]